MPIGTALALGLGLASAAGGVASSAIGAHAAGSAANAQIDAANHAADLQHADAMSALDFQKMMWGAQQANQAPWIQAGGSAIGQLNDLLAPGGALAQGWTGKFNAPTGATEQNDPGYQFRFDQGVQALQRSAAAKGGILSGGTGKQLTRYGQDYASNEYQNVYNRQFGQYQQAYNEFNNNQTNRFNRLASVAGLGQVSASNLNSAGSSAAANMGNILLGSGAQIGQDYNNAGAARASGYVGAANAWSGGINSLSDFLSMPMLYQMMQQQQHA